jgi:hypothetical protein
MLIAVVYKLKLVLDFCVLPIMTTEPFGRIKWLYSSSKLIFPPEWNVLKENWRALRRTAVVRHGNKLTFDR